MAAGAGLQKKLGPLPVWAWGVIVLAVLAYFFLHARAAAAQPQAPSTADQPTQASGAAPDPGQAAAQGLGLDPAMLDALLAQNSTITQSLLDAFSHVYGGGNYTAATGSPYASATPSGTSTASGATSSTAQTSLVTSTTAAPLGTVYVTPDPTYFGSTTTGESTPQAAAAPAGSVQASSPQAIAAADASGRPHDVIVAYSAPGQVKAPPPGSNVHVGGLQM